MPDRALWDNMWSGNFSDVEPSKFMSQYEKLAQVIFRLGMRSSGRKISVWFVVPRVPYVICDPIMECTIALWEKVEGVVSFRFQMTEADSPNVVKKYLFPTFA